MRRLGGVRANASRRSHAELHAAPELDAGDLQALRADSPRRRRARRGGASARCGVGAA
jgi:homocysteine S-methyltransferase